MAFSTVPTVIDGFNAPFGLPRLDTNDLPPYRRTFAGVLGGFVGLVVLSVIAGLLLVAPLAPAIAISGHAARTAV